MRTASAKTTDGTWVRESRAAILKAMVTSKIANQDDVIVVNGKTLAASSVQLNQIESEPTETTNVSVTPNALRINAAANAGGPYAYVKGASILVDILDSNTGATTLQVNSLAVLNILNDGAGLSAGNLKKGYTQKLTFDGAGGATIETDLTIVASRASLSLGKGVNFGPGGVTSITVVNGVIVAIS